MAEEKIAKKSLVKLQKPLLMKNNKQRSHYLKWRKMLNILKKIIVLHYP